MRSVDEHLATILATVRPIAPIDLGLLEAEGGVLTEDITAAHPLPSFDNSAMDGYALHADDVADAGPGHPVTLPVVGEVVAGDTGAYAVTTGAAVRITTGAQLPAGADTVVPVEWTDGGATKVEVRRAAEPGYAIRRTGEDVRAGDQVLAAGTRVGPVQLGLLAAAGRSAVPVRPRPRVAVLSTGNELAEPGSPVTPGRIWESNSFMLAAAARQAGSIAYRRGAVRDEPRALMAAIEDQLMRADVLVTSGGVSMGGEHDVVKDTLSRLGSVEFTKVAMQPGMPQGFGVVGDDRTPIFTLPGNPVSAYVSFQLFVRPALRALQGIDPERLRTVSAMLTGPLRSPEGRRSFARARLERSVVTPLSGQGSHQLATLAAANALIIVPESVTALAMGDEAEVMWLP
ncbi:MAG TPA: gephyrin-like molybdotransferase Glp [Streptosporangiaceae bacterium]|nr:gephyrin-like molybdotransferase Glp [Streptosporangiaceae bacterium]